MRHVLVLFMVALLFPIATAAAGDPGFGNGGVVKSAYPALLEPNGAIVAFGLTGKAFRLGASGSKLPFGYQPKGCRAFFAVRPDGTLAAACGGTLERLTPDGRPDGGGVDVPGVTFSAVAVGSDGTLAASGRDYDGTTVLLRFLADVTPDTQFGRVVVPGPPPSRQGLAVDAVGRILIANGNVRRYLANGAQDQSFAPPSPLGTLIALTADGRIDVCCVTTNLYRLLVDGTPDPSFGLHGAATLHAPDDGLTLYIGGFAPEPDGSTVVAGAFEPARPVPGAGFANFYAQRIRPDGSLGAMGESPSFFDPDTDCWDESGDWVGIARSGAVFVGGTACDQAIEFTMRYTHGLRRDYGPFLTLDLGAWQQKPTVTTHGIVVNGALVANHAADAVIYIRATKADNYTATGPRLPLLPGSRVGGTLLTSPATAVNARVGAATRVHLVLLPNEIAAQRSYDFVVEARRPHLRYRATLEQIFSR